MGCISTVMHPSTATLLQSARKGGIERRCSLLFEVQTDMAVDVERDGDTAVSQHGLHHLGGHAVFEEPRGKGMARVVESDRRESSLCECLGKRAVERAGVNGSAVSVAKDQAVIIIGLSEQEL